MTRAHSSALAGKPCAGCSKFPTYIYCSAHEIPIPAQSRQGTLVVSLNTVTCAVHIRLLARQIHNACILLTAVATRSAPLRRSLPAAALLFYSPTAPCWRRWRGRGYRHANVCPANLKTVHADPSTSSPATTTSRPHQATSRRGSGPSDHHENNYFIRDRG
jgi:hypothetical protein